MGLKVAAVSLVAGKVDCPPQVEAKPGDDIEWVCAAGQAFTVDFGKKTPFPRTSYPAKSYPPKKEKKVKASVLSNAREDTYKYLIAVYDDTSGEVLTLDPELIIRR